MAFHGTLAIQFLLLARSNVGATRVKAPHFSLSSSERIPTYMWSLMELAAAAPVRDTLLAIVRTV